MKSPSMLPPVEPSVSKSQKNKTVLSQHTKGFKVSQKVSKNKALATSLQAETSPLNSFENAYGELRKKYLLLKEESCGVGRELSEVEDEVKVLEKEKLALLDELIVLEGLIDPSELQSKQ